VDYICTNCNYKGPRKKILGGSNFISVMLWTIVPTIYGVWELQAAMPVLTADALSALQSMKDISFGPVDVALSVPGPVYSIWRRVKKTNICPKCSEKIMVAARKGFEAYGSGNEEDLSPENLKKFPLPYAKDIEGYNKRMKASDAAMQPIVSNIAKESNVADKNSW